jgi:hypothetical protein
MMRKIDSLLCIHKIFIIPLRKIDFMHSQKNKKLEIEVHMDRLTVYPLK